MNTALIQIAEKAATAWRGTAQYHQAAEVIDMLVAELQTISARAEEYDKAQQDGRLVVLPCKVGDKVKVDARTWGNTWNFVTVECGKFLIGEIVSIIKTKKQALMKIRVEHNVPWRRVCKRYPVSALGLTVFLTHEGAEAALKEATPCTE